MLYQVIVIGATLIGYTKVKRLFYGLLGIVLYKLYDLRWHWRTVSIHNSLGGVGMVNIVIIR